MKNKPFILLVACYLLLITCITIYSYTQVDLNLTLCSNSTYQLIQQKLTHIGYFNRPLSTIIFSILLTLHIIFYFYLLFRTNPAPATPRSGAGVDHGSGKLGAGAISLKQIWFLIISSSLILTFSYPAFAHDVFNYMFDTKIFIRYKTNPYIATPLDFPQDPWTRFMRWTHVSSVYPPGWLITTIPFHILGFGKFTLTLLSYKLIGMISFLASSWLILKMAGGKNWILWSLNPMILIESLSSVHNEIAMTAFILLAFYLHRTARSRSKQRSDNKNPFLVLLPFISLIWGGLIKYTSFLLIPFLNKPVMAALAAWGAALIFFIAREVNPWYILPAIALSFISKNKILTRTAIAASISIMYRYYPCVAIFSC